MSHGDATTNSNRPQLPNIISRTKESYRRENQRMSTLLRRWEKRSSSCVIVDETKHRTRADFPCRRSLSVNGRSLDAGDHPSTSRCPPNLPLRRKRLSRSLLTPFLRESHRESAKRESAGDSGRSSHGARLDKRRVQRRKLAITAEKRRGGTPKGSECEDVITKSRNESKPRIVTNADKNDDQKSDSASQPEASKSRANVAAEPCDALSRTQHLQSVANAFLTSDDENLYSADEGYDHFWKHDNT
uniref:Uncharacterized protein n=1 Tax=Ciona savignyi TaxID=51511 RepID=H2YIL4_CIOSA